MKLLKYLTLLVPLLLGVAASLWTPLQLWYDMKEGLIAFLGFLAAALVQVMPLTANFLQSDRLSIPEAERLTASMMKQQRYWIGLLSSTIMAMVIVIVGAALKERVAGSAPLFWIIDYSALICFFVATSVSFVLMKMLGLFEGVMSLQRLRGELVINAAKRDAAQKVAMIQREAEIGIKTPIVPEDYGRIVHPH
jgi:hypothetical protein